MRSFLAAPVIVRGELLGNLYLTDKRGCEDFTAEDEELLVAVAGAAGLAVENARLRVEARRHEQWQRATAEVTQQLLAADEPRDVLAVVSQLALEISGADAVALALPNPAGDHITITSASGYHAERLVGMTVPIEPSLAGYVMTSGRRVSGVDFGADERVAWPVRQLGALGPGVVVPLGVPGDVRGVMMVARKTGAQPLSPAAVDMVTTFAVQAGIGLKLAEHRRDTQQIALLADRDRIARDLHDLVIQRLFATGMSLEGGMPLLPDGEGADRVRRAVDELDGTIRDIRSAIYTLQARDEPDQPETHARILAVVQEMTDALGFAPWLRIDGQLDARAPARDGRGHPGRGPGGPVQRRAARPGQPGRHRGHGRRRPGHRDLGRRDGHHGRPGLERPGQPDRARRGTGRRPAGRARRGRRHPAGVARAPARCAAALTGAPSAQGSTRAA